MDPSRIPREFPAPSYRGNQEVALKRISEAFAAGNDVVLVRAPTGSGKSLLARAIMGGAAMIENTRPRDATDAYYTTPQVSQLEDVAVDDLLQDLNVIRGKSNYSCILPGERETPVNRAPCTRDQGFDCSVRHRCPYFSDRAVASESRFAATTLAYFMRTAGSDVFRKRDVVVIDEAHGLAEWAEMYATIELTPSRVPVWDRVGSPDLQDATDPVKRVARFAENLRSACEPAKDQLLQQKEITADEVARRDRLQELISELDWFLQSYRDVDSPTTWVVDETGDGLAIKPLDPARYLQHTVWERGNQFALLSATILSKESFCRGVGLDPADVALVDIPHTFPLENRPLFDVTQGKMTYDRRENTLPRIARLLVRLMTRHPAEKGLVHAHSYAIADELVERLCEFGVGARVRRHDQTDRDAELTAWINGDDPEVFVSVKMEEALDLHGERCRWQVLCKAPYLDTSDSRVARRLERGQWDWYHRAALQTVIQACGRVVRAPDDRGSTYLADTSLLDLFDRAATDTPPWFADQVAAIDSPSLPEFDPDAALSEIDARSNHSPGSGGPSTGEGFSNYSERTGGDGRTRSETDSQRRDDHPLSDVWGDG